MNKKKLVILDLLSNKDIYRENCHILRLDKGIVKLSNYKDITSNLNLQNKKNDDEIAKKILSYLFKFKNLFEDNDVFKSEISNYRNDKIEAFKKISNILEIKKKKLEKKYIVEVITDKFNEKLIYNQFLKNYKLIDLSDNKVLNHHIKFFLSRTKFFFKILFITLYLKAFTKGKDISEYVGLSIFPIFTKNYQINFYQKSKLTYLNFLFTDETHTSKNIFELVKIIQKLKKNKDFYLVERDIKVIDILKNYLLSLKFLFYLNKILKTELYIYNINFNHLLNQYFFESIINLNKLDNYKNPLKKIFKKNTFLKEFHYFLFEYNFGFFLADLIKKNNAKIKLYGYQHGIFDIDNKWLSIISKLSFKKNFFPDIIYYRFKSSKIAYQKKFGKKLFFNDKFPPDNQMKKIFKKLRKNSKNCLFYLGLHDGFEILNEILVQKEFMRKYDKIYIKLHPKKTILKEFFRNDKLKFIKSYDNIYIKDIFVSSTSSLKYSFKELKLPFKSAQVAYK